MRNSDDILLGKPQQFHCIILILSMLAEFMAVCCNLLRWNFREIIVSIFDAVINFLTFYFITQSYAANIDNITVRHCIEGWTDFAEYFSNQNTYVYRWDSWDWLLHFGLSFCHCWVLDILFSLCRFINCVLIGGASFVHRCVRSTKTCTLGFFFWFGALFCCVLAWASQLTLLVFALNGGVSIFPTLEALSNMSRLFAWFTSADQPANFYTVLLRC